MGARSISGESGTGSLCWMMQGDCWWDGMWGRRMLGDEEGMGIGLGCYEEGFYWKEGFYCWLWGCSIMIIVN